VFRFEHPELKWAREIIALYDNEITEQVVETLGLDVVCIMVW
jgi:hypothetical protein